VYGSLCWLNPRTSSRLHLRYILLGPNGYSCASQPHHGLARRLMPFSRSCPKCSAGTAVHWSSQVTPRSVGNGWSECTQPRDRLVRCFLEGCLMRPCLPRPVSPIIASPTYHSYAWSRVEPLLKQGISCCGWYAISSRRLMFPIVGRASSCVAR